MTPIGRGHVASAAVQPYFQGPTPSLSVAPPTAPSMMTRTKLLAVAVAALAASCSSTGSDRAVDAKKSEVGPLAGEAVSAPGRFEFMARALAATSPFDGPGPFTVFAVADSSLELADLATLYAAGGFEGLDRLARFHVVSGRFDSSDLAERTTLTTLTGQRLHLSNWNGRIEVESFGARSYGMSSAHVIEADLPFGQGLMHVVDEPLVPSFESLGERLEQGRTFSMLLAAAQRLGVAGFLDAEVPFTLFAPTDSAFDGLDRHQLATLSADPAALGELLGRHVVLGRHYSDTFHHQPLRTLSGDRIDVTWSRGRAYAGDVVVVGTDFDASNGVIHVVEQLLGRD
jgi:transforming growth factor-beta-induced protein